MKKAGKKYMVRTQDTKYNSSKADTISHQRYLDGDLNQHHYGQ